MQQIKLSPNGKNLQGTYRECSNMKCTRLIPCPYVNCQDHRTDYAIEEYVVQHFEVNEVEIIS